MKKYYESNGEMVEIPPCPIRPEDHNMEFITPDMARELFEGNVGNRNISLSAVNKYVGDILNNRWIFNGDTICIDKYGKTIDGHHRMKAIMETGIGQWCLVVRNLDPVSISTIDTGKSRSPGDVFKMNDIPNSTNMAAVIRGVIMLENRYWASLNGGTKSVAPSNTELLDLYNKNPSAYLESYRFGARCYGMRRLLKSTFVGACHYYLIHHKNHPQEVVEDFFLELFSGKCSMICVEKMRDRLDKEMFNRASKKATLSEKYIRGLLVKCWNAWMTKKDVAVLKFDMEHESGIWFI